MIVQFPCSDAKIIINFINKKDSLKPPILEKCSKHNTLPEVIAYKSDLLQENTKLLFASAIVGA